MYILGLSAFYHDSAACLIKDGEIVAAAQEERFTRIKHDAGFPGAAIRYCLNQAQISGSQVDRVVFYEKPFLKFERLLETYLAFAPRGFRSFAASMPLWIKEKLFQKSMLVTELADVLGTEVNWREKLLFSEHHLSHAASAFYPSPFDSAAVLTLDGVGEWATSSLAVGRGRELKVLKEMQFPHSLGLLYSAFTYYTGFRVNSGEYKLMGLAPYGEPKYVGLIKENLISIAEDGSFQLDMSYFDYATGLTMTTRKFENLFGGPARDPESPITARHTDLAASIQQVTEEVVLRLARGAAHATGEKNLCLAGGVALNCVANGVLERAGVFSNLWIQPAAGDAGGALGAALAAWHLHLERERAPRSARDGMQGSYLGPAFSDDVVREHLDSVGAAYIRLDDVDLVERVAQALAEQQAVGWMQGRMEFGPRALGARSILADPRSPAMQRQLNLKIKYRESFRPFAPSILSEHLQDWFTLQSDSPYMLLVATVQEHRRLKISAEDEALPGVEKLRVPRSSVPAVTHVDSSARIQTVHADTHPRYHALLEAFYAKTGCPLLVNTSFNIRGEPIVCGPEDAFRCFMGTALDVLAIGNFLLLKDEQDPSLRRSYRESYAMD